MESGLGVLGEAFEVMPLRGYLRPSAATGRLGLLLATFGGYWRANARYKNFLQRPEAASSKRSEQVAARGRPVAREAGK